MNEQEVFDKIVTHLRKQGHKALSQTKMDDLRRTPMCAYRVPETGDMCAAGCMIEDDEYDESFEGFTFGGLIDGGFGAPIAMIDRLYPFRRIISYMQGVHDKCEVENWEEQFQFAALTHNLQYIAPEPKVEG